MILHTVLQVGNIPNNITCIYMRLIILHTVQQVGNIPNITCINRKISII